MNDLSILDIVSHDVQYIDAIKAMAHDVSINRAVNNEFYKLWMTEKLNKRQLEIFAVNYFHRIAPTVSRLARTFVSTEDVVSRSHLIRNISDELGHGDANAAHMAILRRWLESLLQKCGGRNFEDVLGDTPVLAVTERLTAESLKLCSGPAPLANGAILAQEWHAYAQLVNLYEGFRNYMNYYELEEFHNSSEYFYIHIGWAEKEHKEQSVVTAARSCHSKEDFDLLKQGFFQFLALLADFWEGLHIELKLHS